MNERVVRGTGLVRSLRELNTFDLGQGGELATI